MQLDQLLDPKMLTEMIHLGYVRQRPHPELPLSILNYTAACQYDRAWNDVTRQCRGLIVNQEGKIIARPWPKFYNWGEHEQGDELEHLSLDDRCVATDKLDGSLGILYSTPRGHAIATRGSFDSEQALWATAYWLKRHEGGAFFPQHNTTYLFEIIYERNRVVLAYEGEGLHLLGAVDNETGRTTKPDYVTGWTGPRAATLPPATVGEALTLEPRPNAEGLVLHLTERDIMVKIKQDDYVALHRILTNTNARNVWEVRAVEACRELIHEATHWASYLGMDPARAEECIALGNEWLEDVPDEFHQWVHDVTQACEDIAHDLQAEALALAKSAEHLSGQARYEAVKHHVLSKEIMAFFKSGDPSGIFLRSWREACPEPTAPFNRSEDVA
jgi:RNA ligase